MIKHSDEKCFSHILFVNMGGGLTAGFILQPSTRGRLQCFDFVKNDLLSQTKQKPKAKSLSARKIFLMYCCWRPSLTPWLRPLSPSPSVLHVHIQVRGVLIPVGGEGAKCWAKQALKRRFWKCPLQKKGSKIFPRCFSPEFAPQLCLVVVSLVCRALLAS